MKITQSQIRKIIQEEIAKVNEEEHAPTEPIAVSAVDADGEVIFTMTWPMGASKDVILDTLEGQLDHSRVDGFDAESGVDWLKNNIQGRPEVMRAFGLETEQDKIDREQYARLANPDSYRYEDDE